MKYDVLNREIKVEDGHAVITSTINETLTLQEIKECKKNINIKILRLQNHIEELIKEKKELLKNRDEINACIEQLEGGTDNAE